MAERYDYIYGKLDEVLASPFEQLTVWLEDAKQAQVLEPTAMCLSTVGQGGYPSSRIVLLRGLDERGLTFFTNYESRKGQELHANANACVNFWWASLERQVRVEGIIVETPVEESDLYWSTRPRESQLASAASPQSRPIESRQDLEEMVSSLRRQYPNDVPRPSHWGGFRLIPNRFEFWQGGPARLHDRIVYRSGDNGWIIERLAP